MNEADRCEHRNYRGDCVHCERAKVEKLTDRLAEAEVENARKTVAIRLLTEAADQLARRLSASDAELQRLKSTQCQWCRGGFDAGD